ncbi:MAG: energy-coupling factor transport system ATP-binding protein [Solirubrobacteraceae bacterium]|nr:energy-coupling factor transport system ATP-binding protein [Solirubrobacteraceae bacterium]
MLELREVTYSYPDARAPALRVVTFAGAEDELVVVAGRSGSGKSTLLRAACGLVPHFHGGEFAGSVEVAGLDTRDNGPGELAEHCGTLLQDPETQVVMGSVRAELAFPLENRGESASAVARGVEEVALALGIAGLLDRPTHELSGGELQRVALGAALAGRPRLLVLDEPASQLDPVAGDELFSLLRRLNEEMGTAILLADHRVERCLPAADRVLVLERGEIVCDAPPREFLTWAGRAAPELQTPGAALFAQARIEPPPTGVKQARAALRRRGIPADGGAWHEPSPGRAPSRNGAPALRLHRVWHEFSGGRAALRGISLSVAPGERVALMGRNGAGKSTLLRHARGLMRPTRGRVEATGPVGLLLQNPGDYFVQDRVADEADAATLALAGLDGLGERHPRDLSGGERQRLALAIVAGGGRSGDVPSAAVCLDEPTRGMDRSARDALVTLLHDIADRGSAVLVATHDVELAAMFAERVVMVGEGTVIADGPPRELLAGGWYFATETARILGGAGGALLPAEGAALLRQGGAVVA